MRYGAILLLRARPVTFLELMMQPLDFGPYFLRVVETDGAVVSEVRLTSRETAIVECDRITRELKADGSLARAFVFDRHDVPIAAGGEHPKSRKRGLQTPHGVV
jgi:hypothetical protein